MALDLQVKKVKKDHMVHQDHLDRWDQLDLGENEVEKDQMALLACEALTVSPDLLVNLVKLENQVQPVSLEHPDPRETWGHQARRVALACKDQEVYIQ